MLTGRATSWTREGYNTERKVRECIGYWEEGLYWNTAQREKAQYVLVLFVWPCLLASSFLPSFCISH